MGENAHLDDNSRPTLIFLANDGSGLIYNGQINPVTGALICEADVLSSNTSIGSTIPGGTAGSVLFLDIGGTLAQDNANFYYNPTSHFLGLGHNAPTATLDLRGTLKIDLGGDSTGDIYFRNSSGFIQALPIGTAGQELTVVGGIPAWTSPSGTFGYDTIETNGTPVTQRHVMNFSTLFTVTDSASPARTNITIDVSALTNDSTFITDLIANNTFTTNLANNSNFYTTLGNNTSFINVLTANSTFISNIVSIVNSNPGITIDLGSQVTGVLPLSHGGTGSNLSDPGANKLWGWDDTDNSIGFWTIGTNLSYNHSTHTLNASGGNSVKFGGTGADGALNISSGVTQIDVGGSPLFVLNYTTVSITGTGALQFINPNSNGTAIIIKATGNVTLTSSATPMIDLSGMGATGGAGGTFTGAGDNSVGGTIGNDGISYGAMETKAGHGATNAPAPGNGGAVGVLTTSGWSTGLIEFIGKYPQEFVGAGGGGAGGRVYVDSGSPSGTVTGGDGGNGGGCLIMEIAGTFNFTTTDGISVAGLDGDDGIASGGGALNGAAAGGGGGGSGGSAFIFYNALTAFTGTVTINGGTGGNTMNTLGNSSAASGGGGAGSATNVGNNGTSAGNGLQTGGNGGSGLSINALNTEYA